MNGYPEGLLGALGINPEDLRRQSMTQGLLSAGLQMLAASGPSPVRQSLGQIVAQGGLAGMQGMQQAEESAIDRALKNMQAQAFITKQKQDQAAIERQNKIQRAISLPTAREQVQALREIGAYPEISALAGAEQTLRRSGVMREPSEMAQANPFAVYVQSSVPGVKKLATQLSQAYDQGTLDDEKATQRLGELARMEESAFARQEAQQDRQLSREQLAAERRLSREQAAVEKEISREERAAERETKRLEGTEGQRLAAGFAARMDAANAIIQQLEGSGGLPTVMTEVAASIPFIGNYAQRTAMSPAQQRYKQAADNWIRANLRKESGAVIGEEEMAAEYRTYFPQPGDTPEVIAQKAQARQITTQAMKQNAGPVYRPTQGAVIPTPAAQDRPRRSLGSIFGQ